MLRDCLPNVVGKERFGRWQRRAIAQLTGFWCVSDGLVNRCVCAQILSMHELGLMDEIVASVARAVDGARVTRVRLEVGRLAAVVPDALRFCFEVCARGTLLEGASLEIAEVSGEGRCRTCGTVMVLDDVLAVCPCGSPDYEVLSGHLIRVKDVEVIDVRDLRLR